jgi:hypothetical protein
VIGGCHHLAQCHIHTGFGGVKGAQGVQALNREILIARSAHDHADHDQPQHEHGQHHGDHGGAATRRKLWIFDLGFWTG